jgi:hypothetical protein
MNRNERKDKREQNQKRNKNNQQLSQKELEKIKGGSYSPAPLSFSDDGSTLQ